MTPMAMRWISSSIVLLGGLVLGGCGGPQCDAEGLRSALAGASGGDVVHVGACRISGDFTLPAGVTLSGEAGSTIAGRIDLSGGGRVEHLAVESNDAGVVAQSGGAVALEDVQVTASTGIGVAADGVASLTMQDVTLRGPVDASNVSALFGTEPDPEETATHGLIVVDVPSATLSGVSSRGFARFGALLKDSVTSWSDGDANENAWVGIMVAQGSATLTDVDVHDTFDLQLADGATFGVVTASAAVASTRLSVMGSGGFGLFHLRGSAVHQDLTARSNSHGGVRLELTGEAELGGEISDNDFGAIVAYGANNLTIRDATIANNAMAIRQENGGVEAGDGIQLVDSTRGALIQNTTISGNDRAGIVIDLFGQNLEAGVFDNVTVERDSAAENGVIVQDGTRATGWDVGLMRDAATVQADEAFTNVIDTVGAVGPCFVPVPQ